MEESSTEQRQLEESRLASQNLVQVAALYKKKKKIKPRKIRWAGHVAHMGEKSNEYRVLVDKPEEKWPFGRFGHR